MILILGFQNCSSGMSVQQVISQSSSSGSSANDVPVVTTPPVGLPPVFVSGEGTSNYKLVGTPVNFNFNINLVPQKGQSFIEPITGATIKRLTDVSKDAPGGGNLYNAYSRYSAENVTGEYVLAITGQTTKVVERSTGKITPLYYDASKRAFGDFHEIRWHMKADHPYRVYFRNGTQFLMIDDVRTQSGSSTLIHDFNADINWNSAADPSSRIIYCDQECNSSHDSDHWAFMAAYYNGVTYVVRAFVHYQISTNTIHTLYPSDLAGFTNAPVGESARETFRYRPNTIEPAPDGSGILMHFGRAYPGSADEYIGTIFEAPYFFPKTFRQSEFKPFRVGADATHSGWGMVGGKWYLLQQDNRRDKFMAVPISGASKGFGAEGQLDVNVNLNKTGVIDFADDNDYTYQNGVHFTAQGAALDGWAMISTYSPVQVSDKPRANMIEFVQIKPIAQNPIRWYVTPSFNLWPTNNKADYNEGSAALNMQGTRIHVPGDWGGTLGHVEVLEIPLPANWQNHWK